MMAVFHGHGVHIEYIVGQEEDWI